MNERSIPKAVLNDPNAVEMVRVWIAENSLFCSLNIGMYKDNKSVSENYAWGVILSDITRQIALALTEESGEDNSKIIDEIKSAYNREMSSPAPPIEGSFS